MTSQHDSSAQSHERSIHNTKDYVMNTDIRQAAYESIDEYAAAKRLVQASRERYGEMPKSTYLAELKQLEATLTDHLNTGTPIPDDIAAPAADAERKHREIILLDETWRRIKDTSKMELERVIDSDSAPAFRKLDESMAALVADVKALAPALLGAASPSDVMTRGAAAVDAWNAIRELTHSYDRIRTVQREFIGNRITNDYWIVFLETGLYRNSIDIVDYWIERRRTAAGGSLDSETEHYKWFTAATSGFVRNHGDNTWWPTGIDHTEHLLHVALNLEPWVPDIATMQQAHSFAFKATKPIRGVGRAQYANSPDEGQAYALEQYYRVNTGEAPLDPSEATDWAAHNKIAKSIDTAAADLKRAADVKTQYRKEADDKEAARRL